MSRIHAGLTGAMVASALAVFASAAVAEDEPKIGVDLTTLTSPVLDILQQVHRRRSQGAGPRAARADQLGIRHRQADHRRPEPDHPRRQGHHLLALRIRGRRDRPQIRRSGGVPVVAVDVAPTTGPVAIVVRANNVAYGEKACKYIGDHVTEGPVVQIMGDQASINGRDRGIGFRDCITKNYPNLTLLEIPTKAWSGEDAAAGLDAILNSTPDLKAIYMHAGGVFLAPTLQTLKREGHAEARRRAGSHHHRQQ